MTKKYIKKLGTASLIGCSLIGTGIGASNIVLTNNTNQTSVKTNETVLTAYEQQVVDSTNDLISILNAHKPTNNDKAFKSFEQSSFNGIYTEQEAEEMVRSFSDDEISRIKRDLTVVYGQEIIEEREDQKFSVSKYWKRSWFIKSLHVIFDARDCHRIMSALAVGCGITSIISALCPSTACVSAILAGCVSIFCAILSEITYGDKSIHIRLTLGFIPTGVWIE